METWNEIKIRHINERIELVEKLAEMNITQKVAAKYLGMNVSALNIFIMRYGISWPASGTVGRKKLELPIDEIKAFYAEGNSLRKCAERFSVSHSTIKGRLIAEGVPIRSTQYGAATEPCAMAAAE